jgi:hypothetical protein
VRFPSRAFADHASGTSAGGNHQFLNLASGPEWLAFVVRFLIVKYHSQGRTSITQRYRRNGILFALRPALTIFLIVVGAYLTLSPLLPHLALSRNGLLTPLGQALLRCSGDRREVRLRRNPHLDERGFCSRLLPSYGTCAARSEKNCCVFSRNACRIPSRGSVPT